MNFGNPLRPAVLLLPALVFLLAFYVVPVGFTLSLSVTEPHLGFGNFRRLLHSSIYLRILANTIEISLTVSLICLVLAYPVAFLLARSTRMRGLLLAMVLVPFFTSLLVRNYAWLFILGARGVVNSALMSVGLIARPLPLMFNRFGVVVAMTHVLLPYLILILFNALRAIDPSLLRAGESLGCGPFGVFRRVVLPLTKAGAGGGTMLVFLIAMAFFVTPAMLGSPREMMIANVIASEVGFLHWGFAAVLSLLLLIAALAVTAVMQQAFGGLALLSPALAREGRPPRPRARAGLWLDAKLQYLDRLLDPVWPGLVGVIGTLILLFLVLPILIVIPLSMSSADYFVFPPPGLSWQWYQALFGSSSWLDAMANSFVIAALTAVLTLMLALPAALGISRGRSRWRVPVFLLIVSPLIVPSIIVAISLFVGVSTIGFGRSVFGIAVGHTIGALPLSVVVLVSAFSAFDWNLERAAQSLGSTPRVIVFRVVVPLIAAEIVTAAFLAFLYSFDDLLVALFLGGIRLETLPLKMWESLQEINPTIAAVSTIMILLMVSILSLITILQRRQEARQRRSH